jgi:hypothetical protein
MIRCATDACFYCKITLDFTIFLGAITASNVIDINALLTFRRIDGQLPTALLAAASVRSRSPTIFDPENKGIRTESFDKTLF